MHLHLRDLLRTIAVRCGRAARRPGWIDPEHNVECRLVADYAGVMSADPVPSPSTLDEAASRLRAGDRAAFEQLYRRHANEVLALLSTKCRGRSDLSADEIAQEVWLLVWRKHSQFDGSHFRGWLFKIAHNVFIDSVRKRKPRMDSLDNEPATSRQEPGVHDLLGVRLDAMKQCLAEQNGEFAIVLRARLSGESYDEIARRLQIPLETAHTQAHRGREQLRKCVERRLS